MKKRVFQSDFVTWMRPANGDLLTGTSWKVLEPRGRVPHRDDPEVDVLGLQWVGAGALQDGKVPVVLLHRLVDAVHGLHGLHPAGDHHGTSCRGGGGAQGHFVTGRNSLLQRLLLQRIPGEPEEHQRPGCVTFLGRLLQVGEVVGVSGTHFEERHVELVEELYCHLEAEERQVKLKTNPNQKERNGQRA